MGFFDKVKDFFYEDEDGEENVVIRPDKPKRENPFKIKEKKEEIKREPVEEKLKR